MDNALLNKFATTIPRENAGPRSSNRFDYQKSWAIVKILDLFQHEDDFKVIFEHHEDIVVLVTNKNGDELIDFFQIKSKSSGNWTVNALTKNDKSLTDSILGKLFGSYLNFPDFTRGLFFISNKQFSVKLHGKTNNEKSSNIDFSRFHNDEKVKIRVATHSTMKNISDIRGLSKFQLRTTELPLENHDVFTKGKILEFFELNQPQKIIHTGLAHRTIFDEVRRKSNYEGQCEDLAQFLDKKTITKRDFEKIIRVITFNKGADEIWNEARELLINEGYALLKIKLIRGDWTEYLIDKMNSENEPVQRLSSKIKELISVIQTNNDDLSLKEIIKNVISNSLEEAGNAGYSEKKLFAAILNEVVEYDPVQEISEKFKEESA